MGGGGDEMGNYYQIKATPVFPGFNKSQDKKYLY